MKYVILQQKNDGFTRIYPIIFAEYMTHSVVAASQQIGLEKLEKLHGIEILTAGFCQWERGEWKCEHGSESLQMPKDSTCDDLDTNLLNYPESFNGIVHG